MKNVLFVLVLLMSLTGCTPRRTASSMSSRADFPDSGSVNKGSTPTTSANTTPATPSKEVHSQAFLDGIKAIEGGRFEEAVTLFTAAIQARPAYAKAYFNRGGAYRGIADNLPKDNSQKPDYYRKAVADFDKGLEMRPDLATANIHNLRARCYIGLKEFPAAIVAGNHAIEHDPKHAPSLCTRGLAYFMFANLELGNPKLDYMKRGVDDMKSAAKIDPSLQKSASEMEDLYEQTKLINGAR